MVLTWQTPPPSPRTVLPPEITYADLYPVRALTSPIDRLNENSSPGCIKVAWRRVLVSSTLNTRLGIEPKNVDTPSPIFSLIPSEFVSAREMSASVVLVGTAIVFSVSDRVLFWGGESFCKVSMMVCVRGSIWTSLPERSGENAVSSPASFCSKTAFCGSRFQSAVISLRSEDMVAVQ